MGEEFTQEHVTTILERLARIESKLDLHESHDKRLRAVEKWQAGIAGIVAFLFIELQIAGLILASLKL